MDLSPLTVLEGKSITLPKPDYNGLEFLYWIDENGVKCESNIIVTKNTTLYAKWRLSDSSNINSSQVVSGEELNKLIDGSITTVSFTYTAIPNKYRSNAKVISLNGNIPVYYYTEGTNASTETEDPFILYYDEGCENLANNLYSSRSSNSNIEVKPITEMN